MGDKRMKKIYQKLHQACLNAGGVKKGEKVKGMHFNPLLHDAVQEVAVQALLDQRLCWFMKIHFILQGRGAVLYLRQI